MLRIAIGSDHGAYELKDYLAGRLEEAGYPVRNLGVFDGNSVDYPDIAELVCHEVLNHNADCGIVLCGTGIGISIAANKIHGIRCAHCSDPYSSRMAIEHNNANVIALGGRTLGPELAWAIVESYLTHTFQGGRHVRRVNKISDLEAKGSC